MTDIANGNTSLVSGKHCTYCPAQRHDKCELRQQEFNAVAYEIDEPKPVEEIVDLGLLGAKLDRADNIESYIKRLRERAELLA